MISKEIESVPIVGRPWQVSLPAICPNCGKPASHKLKIGKVFTRYKIKNKSFNKKPYSVATFFRVPFCWKCAEIHKSEVHPLSIRQILNFLFLFSIFGIPGLLAFWCITLSIEPAFESLRGQDILGVLIINSILLFFIVMTSLFFYKAWTTARHILIVPPTSITKTFDFTDDLSKDFEPVWRNFYFTNYHYARQFSDMNAHRIWNSTGTQAQVASTLRVVRNAVIIGIIAGLILFSLFGSKG